MKSTLILLLAAGSLGVLADEQNEFTIDCIDKIKNKRYIYIAEVVTGQAKRRKPCKALATLMQKILVE